MIVQPSTNYQTKTIAYDVQKNIVLAIVQRIMVTYYKYISNKIYINIYQYSPQVV